MEYRYALLGVQLFDHIGGDKNDAFGDVGRPVSQTLKRMRDIEQIDCAVELGRILPSRIHHFDNNLILKLVHTRVLVRQ